MEKTPYHHPDLRASIIERATSALDLTGAEAFSLRQVSQALGVSAMAVYHHFPNKLALLETLAEQFRRELDAEIGAGIDGTAPATERLVVFGRAYLAYAIRFPARFALMFSPELTLPPQELAEQQPVLFGRFSLLIAEHFGLREPDAIQRAALSVWCSVHGLAVLATAGPLAHSLTAGPEALEEFVGYHLERIIQPWPGQA